jgi:predicted DNA-binding protein
MTKKMTVVFHDEELYKRLKIAAIEKNIPASKIVADAVEEWLESLEDTELIPFAEAIRAEWKEKGGRPWAEVEKEMEEAIAKRDKALLVAERKNVQS